MVYSHRILGLELELFNIFISDLHIGELTVFAFDPRLFQLMAIKNNCEELHDNEWLADEIQCKYTQSKVCGEKHSFCVQGLL